MHPAGSIVLFTTASGAGYGLFVLLALHAALGLVPLEPGLGLAGFGLAFALVTGGLLASTAHLGHPERAWRALSQWRTSWLSREAVAALAVYPPAALFAWAWIADGRLGGWAVAAGALAAALCAATVLCTAMIYAALRPVRAWHTAWTPACYLAFAPMTGALALNALVQAWNYTDRSITSLMTLGLLALGYALKRGYWTATDAPAATSTAETATGLGAYGRVRLLEAPHSEDNFLLTEMGFRIARKHARKLRRIAVLAGFAVPFVLTGLTLATGGWAAAVLALAAALSGGLGIVVERWLFFAEARHSVTLYYGAEAA